MTCPRCGHRSAEGALRCESCDAWLDQPPAGGAAPAEADDEGTRRMPTPELGALPPAPADEHVPEDGTRQIPAPAQQEHAPFEDGGTRPLASRVLAEHAAGHCPGCGEAIGPDWRFCQACGTPLHTSPRTPRSAAAAPTITGYRHVLSELDLDGLQVKKRHELADGKTVVGRVEGEVLVPTDPAMSTRHAVFQVEDRRCLIRDLGSTNGTFVAITRGEPLEPGSVLLCGSQRLLVRTRRDPKGTEHLEIVQVLPLGHSGRVHEITKDSVVVGKSSRADFSFPEDQYLSRRHCEIVSTGRGLVVRDLGSTNRTYLIVRDEKPLESGDRIVLGEQLFEYRLEET